MSLRLSSGGRLIERDRPLDFTFNGRRLRGLAGDSLASALLANGQMLVGRSFKYHRPRGVVASGVEEPNALVGLGRGGRFEPNRRATTVELFDGLEAVSQNHWPGLGFDLGALNDLAARFLPAGFYYKTFMAPRGAWEKLFEPLIRRAAGLGRAPEEPDPDGYEHFHVHVDVLVIGGGISGLQAALTAGRTGARVMLVEQGPHWGGRAPVEGVRLDGRPAAEWVDAALGELERMGNVHLRRRAMAVGVYDHGYALLHERVAAHTPGDGRPRHRLWKVRARRIITATGALERPLAFVGNDVPGVMLASAVRDYVVNWAVAPGRRTVVVTNNDDAYRSALVLREAGLEVPAIVDARPQADGPLVQRAREMGIRVVSGSAIAGVKGRRRVRGVRLCAHEGEGAVLEEIACDAVAMSGGWSPVVHLWSHCGGKLLWEEGQAHFRPDPQRPPTGADGAPLVFAAGNANGRMETAAALADGQVAAEAALKALGTGRERGGARAPLPAVAPEEVAPMLPVWLMPRKAGAKARMKMWLDFQNDVKVSDVELAAREGYESVEHTKRYTTLGMATDQGKLSNINGLAVLSEALGQPVPQTGTTTFRPPWAPVSFGAIAGEARGDLFQPVRETPIHRWHETHGAHWEPVGQWRRPYAYPRDGESLHDAVIREVRNARQAVGLLDASTLGKILVRGPDAGRFLDMIYTNMMSTLKPGRCRYGLICNENGFLIDDGVVVRLDKETFLCHTTTGGAERIHEHMERWLQTEWWDWRVFTADLTEQYAQIAVVGPKARALLERLGGMDVSRESLPFMEWRAGELAGFAVRVFRISFSGELSYEIAVPAGQGLALWERLVEEGAAFGIMPYGTEALHVMRAEKGFIMIGDETDGTVIPQDLGLGWAISKKKADYLGKRAHQRPHMTDPNRWKLVGLETLDGSVLPDGAYAAAEGVNENGQRKVQGRVTSSYFSPTLGRGIALGLVEHGPERMGEVLAFPATGGRIIRARIVSPVFYDKDGEKQNV